MSLEEHVEYIRSDALKEHQRKARRLRESGDKDGYKAVKDTGNAVIFAGTYKGRRKVKDTITTSSLVFCESDGFKTRKAAKAERERVKDYPFVVAAYLSLSGRGVHVVVALDEPPLGSGEPQNKQHKDAWNAVVKALEIFPDVLDPSVKNINRMAYASHDPNAYLADDVKPLAWARKRNREALKATPPPTEYNDWLGWLPTLKALGFSVEQADAWSQQGASYQAGEVEQRWDGLPDDDKADARNKLWGHAVNVIKGKQRSKPDDEPVPINWPAFAATEHKVADWLAEPVLPRGKLTMIYSTGGAGKSLLGLELGAKVALGQAVIDRPESDPLSVVYIDGEMTESDLADRLRSMNINAVELVNLHYYLLQALPPLDTLEGGMALLEICRAHKAEICIIDPLVYMIEGDENESGPIKNMGRFTDAAPQTRRHYAAADGPFRQGQATRATRSQRKTEHRRCYLENDGAWRWRRLSSKLPEGKRRQGWIPERIDLVRTAGPLTHVHVETDSDDKI